MQIGTIISVVGLSYLVEGLDYLVEGHSTITEIVHMMYKELMILGMVAFGLFSYEYSTGHMDLHTKHMFETVHMTLFIVSLMYAAFIGVVLFLSEQTSRVWEQDEDLIESNNRKVRWTLREYSTRVPCCHMIPPPPPWPFCTGIRSTMTGKSFVRNFTWMTLASVSAST